MIADRPPSRSSGGRMLLLAAFACASADAAPVAAGEATVATSMGPSDLLRAHFQFRWPIDPATARPTLLSHPTRASSESEPADGAFFDPMTHGTDWPAHAITLQDLLSSEEPGHTPLEPVSALAHRGQRVLVHGLLADLDAALRALQEGGDDQTFLASREAAPLAGLRLAQQARPRASLY
jgi:hypothetical protein